MSDLDGNAVAGAQDAELLNAALEAQRRGDATEAARRFQQILAVDPRNPAALNALGMQALGRSDMAAAVDMFARAADADPSAPPLWINLATAHRGQGNDEGERVSLSRVLELDQRHLMANIRLAELHERLGETGPATQRWGAVMAICSALPETPPSIVSVLAHAGEYVAAQGAKFGDIVESGLAEAA